MSSQYFHSSEHLGASLASSKTKPGEARVEAERIAFPTTIGVG